MSIIKNITAGPRLQAMFVELKNGREFQFPINDFPRLVNKNHEQLNKYSLSAFGIHWPELDEDLSVINLIKKYGNPLYFLARDCNGNWNIILEVFREEWEATGFRTSNPPFAKRINNLEEILFTGFIERK